MLLIWALHLWFRTRQYLFNTCFPINYTTSHISAHLHQKRMSVWIFSSWTGFRHSLTSHEQNDKLTAAAVTQLKPNGAITLGRFWQLSFQKQMYISSCYLHQNNVWMMIMMMFQWSFVGPDIINMYLTYSYISKSFFIQSPGNLVLVWFK